MQFSDRHAALGSLLALSGTSDGLGEGTIGHPAAGNRDMPPTGKLFEIIRTVDRAWMSRLRALCEEQEAMVKVVTRLKSIDDLNAHAQSG